MEKTHKEKEQTNELVIHYLKLRRLLGLLGISLPLILIIGSFIWDGGHIETSISNYFYTCLRDAFVVILSAVALFLFTYRGYDVWDKWLTNIAGSLGLITAFVSTNFKYDITLPGYKLLSQKLDLSSLTKDGCPTGELLPLSPPSPGCVIEPYTIIPYPHAEYIGYLHLGCAAAFFLTLAVISLCLFTRTDVPKEEFIIKKGKRTQKERRNIFYRFCGWTMIVCIIGLLPCFLNCSVKEFYDKHSLIFWGETVSLLAFGFSWLVKGEFMLKD